MKKLLKSFKTEINPTIEQKTKINKTIGVCDNGSEFRDCNLTGSELRVKSLLIVNSHKGIDVVNGTL